MLGEYAFVIMSSNNGLDQLAEVSSLTDTLHRIQQDLQSLREDVNQLKGSQICYKVAMKGHQRRLHHKVVSRSPLRESREQAGSRKWISLIPF